jgi:hypothetical protein
MRDELVVLPIQRVVPPRKPRTEDDLLPTLPIRGRRAR